MDFFLFSKLNFKEYLGLGSFQFLVYFRRLLIYTFLSIYLRFYIHLSITEITLMATIPMIISSSAQSFIWGPKLDRLKRPSLYVILGEIIAAILHIIMYLVHVSVLHYSLRVAGYVIIIGLAVIELPWSMSNVGWSTLLANKTSDTERTRLWGQLSIIGGTGGIFGALVGGILYQNGLGFAHGTLFYIAAIIMTISAIIIYITVKEGTSTKKSVRLSPKSKNLPISSLNIKIKKIFFLFLIALIFINFGMNSVNQIRALLLKDPNGFNATDNQIALYFDIASFSNIIGGIFLGLVKTKIKDTNLMLIAIIFGVFALLWLPLSINFNFVLISAATFAFAWVVLQASSYSVVARLAPEEYKARMFSYYNSTFFLSYGLGGTLIFGPISDYLVSIGNSDAFSYKFVFFVAAFMVILGFLVVIYSFKLLYKFEKNTQKQENERSEMYKTKLEINEVI